MACPTKETYEIIMYLYNELREGIQREGRREGEEGGVLDRVGDSWRRDCVPLTSLYSICLP